MIAVIDYGMGNLRSVQKALEHVGVEAVITDDPNDLRRAKAIVLPGQGAFGTAMSRLNAAGLSEAIRDEIHRGTPYLGICLGLQLLFASSEEAPGVAGLALFPGTVKRFQEGLKVPHMGWNALHFRRKPPHMCDVREGDYVYFVHSYYVAPGEESVIATTTEYGVSFTSSIWHENVCAMQFHPEKSQRIGLSILKAFGEIIR